MSRTNRIAAFAALALAVALAGTALATRAPTADPQAPAQLDEHETDEQETEEPPSDEVVQRVADRLAVDPATVRDLAAEHGFGPAVRLLAWAAEGVDMQAVLDRRANGEGWGVIAKALQAEGFDVHPGIGSVVGNGGGHGRENAPGQQRQDGADD